MNDRLIIMAGITLVSQVCFAQSALNTADRSQFVDRPSRLKGGNPTPAEPEHNLLLGASTHRSFTGGKLGVSRSQGRSFVALSLAQSNSSGGSSTMAGLYGEWELNQRSYDFAKFTTSLMAGYDHQKPSFNDAFIGLSVAAGLENLELGLSATHLRLWQGSSDDQGFVADVSAKTKLPSLKASVDGGYTFPSKVGGDSDHFIRVSKRFSEAVARVKLSKGSRWTVDIIIPVK